MRAHFLKWRIEYRCLDTNSIPNHQISRIFSALFIFELPLVFTTYCPSTGLKKSKIWVLINYCDNDVNDHKKSGVSIYDISKDMTCQKWAKMLRSEF